MIRTRFAPSPTGNMHIGNLRSALFAYLIAKHYEGEFILRLEDTDQNRYELGAEEFIYKVLELFGLEYDEGPNKNEKYGPYVQSERLDIYKKYAEYLIREGYAYYCFCNQTEINEERMKAEEENRTFLYPGTCRDLPLDEVKKRIANGEKYVIRQKIPKEGTTSYRDLVYGDIRVENSNLEDNILIKSNGYPTYNFANVVDDALMNITHVTRGNEYLSSTPKYVLLYDALRFDTPKFIHLPLLIKKDGSKISKRNKEDNLLQLIHDGFLPSAILNYIALLGWSPKTNQEFFTLEELIENFDISGIQKNPAVYDIQKLKWFNHHYIIKMSDSDYLEYIRPFLEKVYDLENREKYWIDTLLLSYKNHLSFGKEIVLFTHLFFQKEIEFDENAILYIKKNGLNPSFLEIYKTEFSKINNWQISFIQQTLDIIEKRTQLAKERLYMELRILLSGTMHGIDLATLIYLLGKKVIIIRLEEQL